MDHKQLIITAIVLIFVGVVVALARREAPVGSGWAIAIVGAVLWGVDFVTHL